MGNTHSNRPSDAIAVGVPVAEATTPPMTDANVEASTTTPTTTDANATTSATKTTHNKKLDLVFTMDCTGSMGAYITAAKEGITRITQRLAQAEGYDLRYGLVAYRDHPPQDNSYVTKSFPFTMSLEAMQQSLGSLLAQGGGDGPEAVAAALKATHDAEWREDATKVVVLIADAPPHGLGESGDGFPDGGPDGVDPLVVLDQMSARGITIYAVGCQPALSQYRFATEFFIACASRTNGQAVALGSAASLADVILGASVEEMDLEALTDEVQQMAVQLRSVEPTLSDDDVERRVFGMLQSKGVKTRKVGGARLESKHAELVSAASSLAGAKASLCSMGPPPRAPQSLSAFRAGGGGGSSSLSCARGTKTKKAAGVKVLSRGLRRSASPSSPMSDGDGTLSDEELEASMGGCESLAMPAPAPPPPMSVRLEEDAISMSQVSRLYGRGKKKGLW